MIVKLVEEADQREVDPVEPRCSGACNEGLA
jgi:hypothetical protein